MRRANLDFLRRRTSISAISQKATRLPNQIMRLFVARVGGAGFIKSLTIIGIKLGD